MPSLSGRLTNTDGASYLGHRVLLAFEERLGITALTATATASDGADAGAGAATETDEDDLWKPGLRSANVAEDGTFALELPPTEEMRGPFTLEVQGPGGQILHREGFAELPAGELVLPVEPQQVFTIEPHPDPFQGRTVNLTGRVLDAAGERQAMGLQVLIWARSQPAEGEEPPPFHVVLIAQTDDQGYFSGAYPRGAFVEAYGQIGEERIPIQLQAGGAFPRQVVLVVEELVEVGAGDHDGLTPPRAPDELDLVNAPTTFSNDLGGGRCVDFLTPNRALEEFSFSQIVRTTDPQIKGLTLDPPIRLPSSVLEVIDKKIFTQPLVLASHEFALPEISGGEHVLAGNRAVAIGNRFVAAAPASLANTGFAPLGVLGARPIVDAATGVELLREQGVTVRPEVLKKLAADPEGFTPRELMTAERSTAFEYLGNVLDVLKKPVPGRGELSVGNAVDWDDTPTFYQATTIAHGHVLHFKQVWRADGYSLGDLLYSLPLAPCQKKQVAIVDWERREIATRTEQRTEEERLAAVLSRDRDISEIVNTTLTESVRGGSEASTWAAGGGLGLAIGPLVLGAAGGGGGASSTAWQNSARNLTASSLQGLRDRTMQAASAVRSQRATVVQTARQGETIRVETEVVANHNHCHAMTVQYFEVLRHFQVSQELADVQECLFVPLLMGRFDSAKALRWRESLRRFLRDRGLAGGFDALERIRLNYEGSDLPTGSYAQGNLEFLDGELRLALTIARPRDPNEGENLLNYYDSVWRFWGALIGGNARDVYNAYLRDQQARDRIFQEQLAPRIAAAFVAALRVSLVNTNGAEHPVDLDPTLVSDYRPGVPLYVRLSSRGTVPGLRREQIAGVRIRTEHELPPDSKSVVHTAYVRYRTRHLNHALVPVSRVMNDLSVGDDVFVASPLDRAELRNPRQEDQELARRLLAHLNEHHEYYHKVIWWTMDADRRFMLLDGFVAPNSGGRSVASVVENRLIGIVGNSLVLPVARGFHLDPTYRQDAENPVDLFDHYAPTTPIPPMRVSVPTKGVFAESVMGACNSCEVKDDTRFWRWEESPCGDEPAAIQPVSTESRRTEPPDLKPTDFPTPIINLQNAPAAPDPTGLAAALQLIGKPDLFRDITGLTENQKNALAAFQQAMGTAQFFGGEASKLAQQQALSRDFDRTMKAVKQARQDGMITDGQAQELTMSALRGLVAEERRPQQRLTQEPEVRDLVRSATETPSSEVNLTRPDGESVNVRLNPADGGLSSLFGGGARPGSVSSGSSRTDALAHVAAFRARTGASPWKLNRIEVADRLVQLINDPNLFDQDHLNLCGPAAFFRLWTARDPLAFARFATELYERGESRINSYRVKPSDDSLISKDYAAIKTQVEKDPKKKFAPAADWMVMGALRDVENFFFDFEGTPEEDVSAATTPAEIAEWLEATNLYSAVRNEGNFFFTKGLAHAKGLSPNANRDVVMFINAHMLSDAAVVRGQKKSKEFISAAFPNHHVVLTSPVVETTDGKIQFDCWTWGLPITTYKVNKDVFEANYYGAVIAAR